MSSNQGVSWSLRGVRRIVPLVAVLSVVGTVGCGGANQAANAKTGKPKVDPQAEYRRLMSRENGPFRKHRLQVFDGLVTGEYEAASPAEPDCTAPDSDGDSACEVRLDLGKDADGDPSDILCFLDTSPRGPFGTVFANRLDGGTLLEMPQLAVTKSGDGLRIDIAANWMKSGDETNIVGTMKIAMLYRQGYTATCSDIRAGGTKTFARVVGNFFDSLTFAPNPRRPVFLTAAYELKKGESSTGYRFILVEKRNGGKEGSAESDFSFHLETNGKQWRMLDSNLFVFRNGGGNVDYYRHVIGTGGEGGIVLTAKPSEDQKFRLKVERGDKSDALELTPRAPLTTEVWSAPEFAKVARGSREGFRYARVGLDDSGDPTFRYMSITRSSSDVLLEEEEGDLAAKKKLEGSTKDELHVGGDGAVTKEVSSESVSTRLFVNGSLPIPTSGAQEKTAPKKPTAKKDRK